MHRVERAILEQVRCYNRYERIEMPLHGVMNC